MKTIHEIRFPNYQDDIMSEKRTLFHNPVDDGHAWQVGDGLRLIAHPSLPRCKIGTLIDVRQVRLLAELDVDLVKLGVTERGEYLARWDALHPEFPFKDDPLVWRIEFRYGAWESDPTDPPEWSLAS